MLSVLERRSPRYAAKNSAKDYVHFLGCGFVVALENGDGYRSVAMLHMISPGCLGQTLRVSHVDPSSAGDEHRQSGQQGPNQLRADVPDAAIEDGFQDLGASITATRAGRSAQAPLGM
jgi:hypothetical protein